MDKAVILADEETLKLRCSRCHCQSPYPFAALDNNFVKTTVCGNTKCKKAILIINVDAFKSLICLD